MARTAANETFQTNFRIYRSEIYRHVKTSTSLFTDEMKEKTLFQQIEDGKIPADMIYEDDECIAFRDINPAAPTHVLIVPRKPIPTLDALEEVDEMLVGHLLFVASRLASELHLTDGYRTVINCGRHGQQSVPHLHVHLIGGRQMTWPPG